MHPQVHQGPLKEPDVTLNYETIFQHFLSSEFYVEPALVNDKDALSVTFEAAEKLVSIIHICTDELFQLPQFYLKNYKAYGSLAHVLPSSFYDEYGYICVNHLDSVSVNFERPELAFEESIRRHIKLLKSQLENPDFNQMELKREFLTNWQKSAEYLYDSGSKYLFCSSNGDDCQKLELYSPFSRRSKFSIPASFVALPSNGESAAIAEYFGKEKRTPRANCLCFVIPLEEVDTSFPQTESELKLWLADALARVSESTKKIIKTELWGPRVKEFWLVLNLPTPSGKSWFGIRLFRDEKKPFPNTFEKMSGWKASLFHVDSYNRERLMPRSGAESTLADKHVLLVGCGSVGSELAHKLGAAGVGEIDISDTDIFTPSNTYRHTLDQSSIYQFKSTSVAKQLMKKYPWVKATGQLYSLLSLRKKELLSLYDLIIVAVGNPTHERLFHEYISESGIKTPAIYTWLEGYGVGGHAVLSVPNKSGCLRCAYVEPETGARGLASNLNFLTEDQDIVKNHAGCGEMFIPYGAVSSTQTAVMAADLGIRFLNKQVTSSTKVSWKGDGADAVREGLKFTPRSNNFQASLEKHPLLHPLCDTCNSIDGNEYQHGSMRIRIPSSIERQLSSYRQISPNMTEAAGLLIGFNKSSGETCIHQLTTPKETDTRHRAHFKLDAQAHQQEVDAAFKGSDHMLGYLGTWHTHPQDFPEPSMPDITDWQTHNKENHERQLFFIVVGRLKIAVYTVMDDKIIELKPTNPEACSNA
ncbi:ThiF family adenylyltransferase [Parendozoicomonas haliclonae]|uniref:Sulfur carrier protein ThiS adenylyltransferase n=1 Tax=Parendozoicomonas haliclonae TaxID=1960125 RepID=A0A1X7AK51_9GAMM|nr:Sulfur carrier protein ThiS adenylyltransferase [Parendozoicomonas haliclonae]